MTLKIVRRKSVNPEHVTEAYLVGPPSALCLFTIAIRPAHDQDSHAKAIVIKANYFHIMYGASTMDLNGRMSQQFRSQATYNNNNNNNRGKQQQQNDSDAFMRLVCYLIYSDR